MAVIRVFSQALGHLNVRGYLYVWANILWFVLSLPVVTAPAAWAGLVHLSHTAQTGTQVRLEDFWIGFRANFRRSIVISLATIAIVYVNLINLLAVQLNSALLTGMLRAIWIAAILLWFSLQLYLWPLLEEMERPSLRTGLQNALIMTARFPLFTLGLWAGILPLVALSTAFFPAWFLLTGSALAILATSATRDRLLAR